MSLKYKISLSFIIAIALLAIKLHAQTFVPIKVTGFNHDLIAEGSGGINRAAATTTTTFDNVNVGGDNVMYSTDFRGNNNQNLAPPFGLPVNGLINSVNLLGAKYQLAPYDGSNALVLKAINSSATLILESPGVFSEIAILGSSAEMASSFSVTLNFSDGSNQIKNFTVPDWFNGSNYAVKGIGRVTRTQISNQAPDQFSGTSENPRLYDNKIILDAPYNGRVLSNITFTKTSPTGNTAILAINGITAINAPVAPVAIAATNINPTDFTANWQSVSSATKYFLDVSTDSTFKTYLTGYNNRDVGNILSLNITGIPVAPVYYYQVRAFNNSGTSANSNRILVSAKDIHAISVTGFNYDLIANGSGTNQANASTTNDLNSFVLYSKDFRGNTNANREPTYGLPSNGKITNLNLVGYDYQLSNYNDKNAIVLKTVNESDTLVLNQPNNYFKVAILATSSSGDAQITAVLNFSDGSTTSADFTIPDWFRGTDIAAKGVGRVNKSSDVFSPDESVEAPRLFNLVTNLMPPFDNRILTSVIFIKKDVAATQAAVLALTGLGSKILSTPIALAATNITATGFTANWNPVTEANEYFIDVSQNSNFSTFVNGYNNRLVGNVQSFNVSGLSNMPNYYYRIRAGNSGRRSANSNIIQVMLPQCPIGDVTVNTQAEADNFKILYPNCTTINGSLNIQNSSNITNLSGFSNITTVNGNINIFNNNVLTDCYGLRGIKRASNIYINQNSQLAEVNAFDSLSIIDYIEISNNPKLRYISGFPKVNILYELHILNNPLLTDINVKLQTNQLNVLNIKNNDKLFILNNLGAIKEIKVALNIEDNFLLNNVNGLNLLTNIKEIKIKDNQALTNLNGLSNVTAVDGAIIIQNNDMLNDISGLRNIVYTTIKNTGLIIQDNAILSFCNLPNFCSYLQGTGARNISGNLSDCLTEQAVINACNALAAPNASAATNITASGFTANWQASVGATKYLLDVSTSSSFGSFVTGYNNRDVGNVLNFNVTGLTTNITYYYRIRANNAFGTSPNSNVISLTTSNSAPTAPQATAASNINSTGFTANWNVVGNATEYFIDISTNSNFSNFVAGYNDLSVGNVQSRNITGLTFNTTYYYRIRAKNAVGTSPNSNVISLTTLDNGGNCTIAIPDARFKNYLIGNLNINSNGDTEIQCAEAENYSGEINCSNLKIIDFTGIEFFINLTGLKCNDNQISSIDVSKNTKLKTIACYNNQITNLNLQLNTQLIEVYCYNNKLIEFNLKKNVLLQKLGCNDNLIEDLDISANNNLTHLWCYNNKLAFLNLANGINEDMALIEAFNNLDLECIKVDNADYSNNNWRKAPFQFDAQHEFNEECDACDEWREKLNSNFLISANACIGDTIHLIDYSNLEIENDITFTWDFGNGATSIERDPEVIYNAPGKYTISLIVNNISCQSLIIQKDISILSCLNNPKNNQNLAMIFPTPNVGKPEIFVKLIEKSPILLKIFDSNGRLIKSYSYDETKLLTEHITIDHPGVYWLELIHRNGIEKLKTFVIK